MKKVGIYRIISPSGKVYIGQSRWILSRRSKYKTELAPGQHKLRASLIKYGFDKHIFEVIHSLPIDVSQDILNNYEIYYLETYISAGFSMLNCRPGGMVVVHNDESKARISESKKKYFRDTPGALEKASNAMKKYHKENPSHRLNQASKIKTGLTPERRVAMGEKVRNWSNKNPEFRIYLGSIIKKKYSDPIELDKMRLTHPTNKKIICIDTGIEYMSLSHASRCLGISVQCISGVVRGVKLTTHGLKFKFVC